MLLLVVVVMVMVMVKGFSQRLRLLLEGEIANLAGYSNWLLMKLLV